MPTTAFGPFSPSRFAASRGTDVVVTQPLRVDVARGYGAGARIVYDLYVPSFVEYRGARRRAALARSP